MNADPTTVTLKQAADLLRQTSEPLAILTHARPDGDALGSVLALTLVLRSMGKMVYPLLTGVVSPSLLELPGAEHLTFYQQGDPLPDVDLRVVVDTSAQSQLGILWPYVQPHLDHTLIIDHHLRGDVRGAHQHIDSSAGACAQLVADLVSHLNPDAISLPVATALYAGLATDTGWFRFSNTSPATLRLAADLIESGVDHAGLRIDLEQNESPGKLALIAKALTSLRYVAGGRAAIMTLSLDDFSATQTTSADTEGIVNFPLDVGSVQAAALLTERQNEDFSRFIRLSFRSKPITPAHPHALDVSALAGRFDGGGHARAAGGRCDRPLEQAVREVDAAFVEVFQPHEIPSR